MRTGIPLPHHTTARRLRAQRRRWSAVTASTFVLAVLICASAVIAADLNFILKWGTPGTGDGQMLTPRGMAVDTAGNVYVAEGNGNRISKFDANGNFLSKFGVGGDVNGGFVTPSGVAVDSSGNIYTTDDFTNRVQKFTSAGAFVLTWGGFTTLSGVAVDSLGNVYTTDSGTHRVTKFTSTGTLITQWGSSGAGDGQFSGPQGLAVDAANNVYVADTGNNRIQKFTSAGTFVTKWGAAGAGDGQFNTPGGVGTDTAGNVYVADTGNSRIQKFTSAGTFVSAFGTAGSGDGEFSGPQDLAGGVDVVYVADTGSDRVQKLGTAAAPPAVADAGPDQTVECAGATTSVTLNGTGSTGSGTLTYAWSEGATSLGSGSTLVVALPTGAHTITLTVTDANGSDTDTVSINIVDTAAPTINCPADVFVTLPPNSAAITAPASFTVTAGDTCSANVTVSTDHASGSNFPLGTTTVNATADDHNGHTSSCSFHVTVGYNFAGFFPPVGNLPVVNVVKAGRAVPVKFSLSGNKGLGIFAPGSPASGPIACNSSDPAATLEETLTAGGSSLSYDAATDQYVYVWKTEASWAGTCRQLVVTLNDGSTHRANFQFK